MVLIRPADDADLEAVGRVHALSRHHAYAGLVPEAALARVTPETQARVWRDRMREPVTRSALVVAVDPSTQLRTGDQVVVGFTHAVAAGGERPAELQAIHVLPDRLGSGAGSALHTAAVDAFLSWGCDQAELWVLRGNERAQAFYRRCGWVHDGTTSQHGVGGVDVPILRYVLDLRSC